MISALDKLNVRHISTSALVDHPLPRYSVIADDTLRDLVTLTFDLLTLVSGHT